MHCCVPMCATSSQPRLGAPPCANVHPHPPSPPGPLSKGSRKPHIASGTPANILSEYKLVPCTAQHLRPHTPWSLESPAPPASGPRGGAAAPSLTDGPLPRRRLCCSAPHSLRAFPPHLGCAALCAPDVSPEGNNVHKRFRRALPGPRRPRLFRHTPHILRSAFRGGARPYYPPQPGAVSR